MDKCNSGKANLSISKVQPGKALNDRQSDEGRLIIRTKRGIHVFAFEDILFMEKDLKRIIIHSSQGEVPFYGRFTDIMERLDERFLWCHRSYVINMDKIVWMEDNEIYIEGNFHVHMGNNTFRRARHIFSDYLDKKKG